MEILFQMDIIEDEQFYEEEIYSEETKYLLTSIDPYETDQIIFSEIVKLLTTHPAKQEENLSEPGLEQISVLEKFVTKAIEREESQKRIMIKLQERIIEENKQGGNPENFEIEESDKLLYEKNSFSMFQINHTNLDPKSFENLESQAMDDLKQDYERYENYQVNRDEGETDGNQNLEANYLVKGLDPVEEDDKEEQSQRSAMDSLKKGPSINTSDKGNNEGNLIVN